jgi:hypothetical protein
MHNRTYGIVGLFLIALACHGVEAQPEPVERLGETDLVPPEDFGEAKQELVLVPQRKYGVFYEPGIFRDSDPNTPDQPFVAYTLWDGNNFVVIGTFGTTVLDLSLPPGSDPTSVTFWEYAIDASCTGSALRVECSATENVYFVGNPTPFQIGLDWSMTRIVGEGSPTYAFISNDQPPAANGVDSITRPVADEATCLQVMEIIRDLLAENNVTLPNIRTSDAACD